MLRGIKCAQPGDCGNRADGVIRPFGEAVIYTIALGGDGKHVSLAGRFSDRSGVRIYDVASAKQVSPNLVHRAAGQLILSAAFSPDGQTFLTCGPNELAQLWDAGTKQPRGGALRHAGRIHAGCWKPLKGTSGCPGRRSSTGASRWGNDRGGIEARRHERQRAAMGGTAPIYPASLSSSTLCAIFGSALPRDTFITCPTKNCSSLVSPPR